MASKTSIEWTEITWNPVTGCTKVSQGCKFCYAERMAARLHAMGSARYINGFNVTLHEDLVEAPFMWQKPRVIFVNSMSDLFHESVPLAFIARIFETMRNCPQHVFQILTKRSGRLLEVAPQLQWPENVWMGVSVEDKQATYRITDLCQVNAHVRFLSCEPLLGPLGSLNLQGVHWVIAGGESGPGSRPMSPKWVESILEQCRQQNVAFFFKQWGGVRKDLAGRQLHDQTYDEYPEAAYLHPSFSTPVA